MRSRKYFKLFLLLMLLLAVINLTKGRGGGGGRRGGSLFSWRGKKKSSSLSSRRQSSGSQVSGSLGSNVGYKPLKPITQSKPQTPSYPKQHLATGATYYASGSSLPQEAMYHGYYSNGVLNARSIRPGRFYANASVLPPNAVLYAQPSRSTFGPGNFLLSMYAGYMLNQGLFGHHPHALNVHQDSKDKQQDNKEKILIINNAPASLDKSNGFADKTMAFQYSDEELPIDILNSTSEKSNNTKKQNATTVQDTTISEQTVFKYGIICFPLMVNETDVENHESVREGKQIFCYPAPPVSSKQAALIPQSEAYSGIICLPRKSIETNYTDNMQNIVPSKQDCYPAPPTSTWTEENLSTKPPEIFIGNISDDEEMMTEQQQEAIVTRETTQTILKDLQEKEKKALRDIVKQFPHELAKSEVHVADDESFRFSSSQSDKLHSLCAMLIPFIILQNL